MMRWYIGIKMRIIRWELRHIENRIWAEETRASALRLYHERLLVRLGMH